MITALIKITIYKIFHLYKLYTVFIHSFPFLNIKNQIQSSIVFNKIKGNRKVYLNKLLKFTIEIRKFKGFLELFDVQ